jgi:hypothetical protein
LSNFTWVAVFINAGVLWIANFIRENYPNATDILDFYHASEYLYEFSKVIFSKKKQAVEKAEWLDKQILRLLNDKVENVIEEVKKIKLKGKIKITAQEKISTYYNNNQQRMLYKTYRDRGLLIGSGPIESAISFCFTKKNETPKSKMNKKSGQTIANSLIFNS